MLRLLMLCCLLPLAVETFAQNAEQEHRWQQQSAPKMRTVDRDWEYFKAVPCEQVSQLVFHSDSEEILIAKRKSQCLNQYKAFFPNPIDK